MAKPTPKPRPRAGFTKGRPLAAQMKQRSSKPNPFELKSSKSHFETLGRRTSGVKKNVVKAREEAVTRVRLARLSPPFPVIRTAAHPAPTLHLPGWGRIYIKVYEPPTPATPQPPIPVRPPHALTRGTLLVACLQRKSTLLVEYKQLRKANTFIDRRFGGAPPVCGTAPKPDAPCLQLHACLHASSSEMRPEDPWPTASTRMQTRDLACAPPRTHVLARRQRGRVLTAPCVACLFAAGRRE